MKILVTFFSVFDPQSSLYYRHISLTVSFRTSRISLDSRLISRMRVISLLCCIYSRPQKVPEIPAAFSLLCLFLLPKIP